MTADLYPALEECERRINGGIATFIEVGCLLVEAEEQLGAEGLQAFAVRLGIDLDMLAGLMPVIRQVIA